MSTIALNKNEKMSDTGTDGAGYVFLRISKKGVLTKSLCTSLCQTQKELSYRCCIYFNICVLSSFFKHVTYAKYVLSKTPFKRFYESHKGRPCYADIFTAFDLTFSRHEISRFNMVQSSRAYFLRHN